MLNNMMYIPSQTKLIFDMNHVEASLWVKTMCDHGDIEILKIVESDVEINTVLKT